MTNKKIQTKLIELVDENRSFIDYVNQSHPDECVSFDDWDYANEFKKQLNSNFYKQFESADTRSDEELANEVRNSPYQQYEKKDGNDEVKKMLWTLCGRHGLETEYMLFDSLNDIALDIEEKTGLYLEADVRL